MKRREGGVMVSIPHINNGWIKRCLRRMRMRMKKWFYKLYTLVVCLVGRYIYFPKSILLFTVPVLLLRS